MYQEDLSKTFGKSTPENYERYFVPAIGTPLAKDLVEIAALRPNERILDVACGTGVVARLASRRVGASGIVAGMDINSDMLAVARSVKLSEIPIGWYEASAESIPFPDESFDVVMCQMGLQFIPDKHTALCEMQRVLVSGGRLILNVPGPIPQQFTFLENAFIRHIGTGAAQFINLVFSLHDTTEIKNLINGAGFRNVSAQPENKRLRLPAPRDFLWQYVYSTPLADVMAQVDDDHRSALEDEVVGNWEKFVKDNVLILQVRIVTATALK